MLRPALPRPQPLTLILLSALAGLPVSMFPPSLPGIARAFAANYAVVNLAVAGYAWIAAVAQLVMGPLSDRYGRRPVLLAALVTFTLASLGCALAGDVATFLAFRLLQAAVIAGYSVTLAVISDSWDEREAAGVIGYVAVGWALAPMLGPVLGGLLDGLLGWRAIFWTLALAGLAVLATCTAGLPETNRSPSATVAGRFRAFPELLGSRRYWAYVLCMTFTTGAFYAFLSAAPWAAKVLFAMPPATLGFYMGSSTAGFMLGSFLAGRYASRGAPAMTMIAGMAIACAGLAVGLALLSLGIVHVVSVFGPCVSFGLGNGLALAGASAGAMSVRPHLAGAASGLAGALSVAGGAAFSSLTGALLTEANGGHVLLGMMLCSCSAALAAAYCVLRLDRQAPAPAAASGG